MHAINCLVRSVCKRFHYPTPAHFTFDELLIAIAIIAILSCIITPVLLRSERTINLTASWQEPPGSGFPTR